MKRTVVTTTTTTLQTRAYQQRAIRGGVGEGLRRSRGDLGVVADSYVDCHGFDHHTRNDISSAARLRAQRQLIPSALMPVPGRVHSELGTDRPPVYSSGIHPTVHICGLLSCAAGLQAAQGRMDP